MPTMRWASDLKRHLHDFLSSSSLHGVGFLSRRDLSAVGRAFWASALIASLVAVSINIVSFMHDSERNAVSTALTSVPVQEAFFPAISIDAGNMHYFIRYPEEVFNNVIFDCASIPDESDDWQQQDCLKKRQEVINKYETFITYSAHNILKILRIYLRYLEFEKSTNVFQLACPSGTRSAIDRAGSYRHMLLTGLVLLKKENSSNDTVDHTPFLAKLATQVWRAPKDSVSTLWTQALDGYRLPSVGNDENACIQIVSRMPSSVQQAMASLAILIDDVTRFSLGDMLTAGMLIQLSSILESSPGSEIQGDFKKALHSINQNLPIKAKALEGQYRIYENGPAAELGEGDVKRKNETQSYANILKTMRYTKQAVGRKITEEGELRDILQALDSLGLPVQSNGNLTHEYPRILGCRLMPLESFDYECPYFNKIFSTHGLAYAFNSFPFEDMYNIGNEGIRTFWEEVNKISGAYGPKQPRTIANFGPSSALEFYLHVPSFILNHWRVLDRDVGFRLAVHSPQDVPNLANTPLRLKPGRAYTITFTPQETTSDKDVEALALKQRSCRFPHEMEGVLTIFENYTQSACLFECTLRRARSECGCIPWDFPQLSDSSFPTTANVCNFTATWCFEDFFTYKPGNARDCGCLPGCESVEYDVSFYHEPLDPKILCRDPPSLILPRASKLNIFKMRETIKNRLIPQLWEENLHEAENPYMSCVKTLNEEVVFVRVFADSGFFQRINLSRRVPPSGQVSGIGGILSLFTGMSILTLGEGAFWAARIVRAIFKPEKPKKKQGC